LKVINIVGGYDEYKKYIDQEDNSKINIISKPQKQNLLNVKSVSNKLSYKDQRLLEILPQEISKLEEEIKEIQNIIAGDALLYSTDQKKFNELSQALINKQKLIEEKTLKWLEIDELKSSL
jgi:ATP-binding cassette subfamily F protein uup